MDHLIVQRALAAVRALAPYAVYASAKALEAAGGNPSGFPTPQWTLEATLRSMDLANTQVAILSLSTPGIPIAGTGEVARSLTRTINEYFSNATSLPKNTARLGFFGRDVNGTLAELDYLYSEQKLCNGVTAYTTYGDRLLGDPLFAPVWDRLQRYKALVFVHPDTLTVAPKFVASSLAQPIVDYPLATTRTAVDLVMTQTMRRCPDVDVILSHAGGAVPFLAGRAIGGLALPEIADAVGYNALGAKKDFARFYYDIALSTSAAQLHGLLDFADASHILFGSDFPYVPKAAISTLLAQYATFVTTDARGPMVSPARLRENSLKLLNRHTLGKAF
ncbi:uncharacterized protein B0I36DRAFT_426093 [Microdochium trichocladiopsis]|uniref:6-methylsalicylate decarboxylase n=1 Tax=Microdochium trichocladiopsis TaxID=1682393 RepID=A0A9P8XSZ8_9PEZI|nr:uncharacterized protein B0I36DRAFT_426093 [Microdochium trichocladiopsis]KAH7010604.1 hypothetical protein B0I36DRAFT_426093 [Microdochium trichocladiopsis]